MRLYQYPGLLHRRTTVPQDDRPQMPMSGYDVSGLNKSLCGAMQTTQIVLMWRIVVYNIPVGCGRDAQAKQSDAMINIKVTEESDETLPCSWCSAQAMTLDGLQCRCVAIEILEPSATVITQFDKELYLQISGSSALSSLPRAHSAPTAHSLIAEKSDLSPDDIHLGTSLLCPRPPIDRRIVLAQSSDSEHCEASARPNLAWTQTQNSC